LGGAYPAVVNILLAQMARQSSGAGVHLDVALSESAIAFAYWAHAAGVIVRPQIDSGGRHLTGRLARHRMKAALDGRQTAVGAREEMIWQVFSDLLTLPPELRDDRSAPETCRAEVARRLGCQPPTDWKPHLAGADC